MSDSERMRRILERKLNDPKWLNSADRVYESIVNDSPVREAAPLQNSTSVQFEPITAFGASSAFRLDLSELALPKFDEPTTIDELWLDRWQRSSGGFTLTRTLDDTVQLDYPEGDRYIYSIAMEPAGGYFWIAEEFRPGGRRLKTYRTTELFEDYDEALFEMHRAAITEFEELTNIM